VIVTRANSEHQERRNLSIAAVAAGLICLIVYLRALSCGFVNLDDPVYVINNSTIRHLDTNLISAAFTRPYYLGWLPFTYISFALDYHFWGLNPVGYHLTNILLHACNVGLVVIITDSICRQGFPQVRENAERQWLYPAMLVITGLLFGLHPLRVESVTWVSQRKDVLNGLFVLGAVLSYLLYVRKKEAAAEAWAIRRHYLLSLVLFLFSLMAKQVSVVLPLLLLVIDWYPCGRLNRKNLPIILLEKLPFLAISLLVSAATVHFASQGKALIMAADFPYYARLLVSGNAVFEYGRFFLYPLGIQPYFVIGDEIQTAFVVKTAAVAVITLGCVATLSRKPAYTATWLGFLLPLLPVLAFTQTADDTALASRYTYLPSVAPTIAAGILLAGACQVAAAKKALPAKALLALLLALLIAGYGAVTWHLIAAWRNPETLWTRQIKLQPLGRAYTFRGIHYFTTGNHAAALDDFAESFRIARNAGRDDIFNLLAYQGEALRAMGRHEEAIESLTAAINISPYPQYFYFRACALQALGRQAEAGEDLRRAGMDRGPIRWFPQKAE